ncbi:hypothetical protein A3Q56_01974, partial [Intoshia linei]
MNSMIKVIMNKNMEYFETLKTSVDGLSLCCEYLNKYENCEDLFNHLTVLEYYAKQHLPLPQFNHLKCSFLEFVVRDYGKIQKYVKNKVSKICSDIFFVRLHPWPTFFVDIMKLCANDEELINFYLNTLLYISDEISNPLYNHAYVFTWNIKNIKDKIRNDSADDIISSLFFIIKKYYKEAKNNNVIESFKLIGSFSQWISLITIMTDEFMEIVTACLIENVDNSIIESCIDCWIDILTKKICLNEKCQVYKYMGDVMNKRMEVFGQIYKSSNICDIEPFSKLFNKAIEVATNCILTEKKNSESNGEILVYLESYVSQTIQLFNISDYSHLATSGILKYVQFLKKFKYPKELEPKIIQIFENCLCLLTAKSYKDLDEEEICERKNHCLIIVNCASLIPCYILKKLTVESDIFLTNDKSYETFLYLLNNIQDMYSKFFKKHPKEGESQFIILLNNFDSIKTSFLSIKYFQVINKYDIFVNPDNVIIVLKYYLSEFGIFSSDFQNSITLMELFSKFMKNNIIHIKEECINDILSALMSILTIPGDISDSDYGKKLSNVYSCSSYLILKSQMEIQNKKAYFSGLIQTLENLYAEITTKLNESNEI